MSAREAILAAVRNNLPQPAVPLPEIPRSERKGVKHGLGYKEHFTWLPEVAGAPGVDEPLLPYFRRQLDAMGGRSFDVADAAAARAKVAELFPDANVVCSAVPEVSGTRRIEDVRDPHELNDVDVGVVRSPLGVAEAGAVWLTQTELVINALGVLSQHLVVLLDPEAVVETMHDAYGRIDLAASPYGVFMAGPSATGDIEGVIIHGAQGARSLTVLLLRAPRGRSTRIVGDRTQREERDPTMITLERPGPSTPAHSPRGVNLLNHPALNKGTAFAEDERVKLGLHGLLPPQVESLDEQVVRTYEAKDDDLERHIYLRALQDTNEVLFYRLLLDHIEEMTPVVYTPVVAQACEQFSHIYRRPRGLVLSYPLRDSIPTLLARRSTASPRDWCAWCAAFCGTRTPCSQWGVKCRKFWVSVT